MASLMYLLVLSLATSTLGFQISSKCVNVCNTQSTLKCSAAFALNDLTLKSLEANYDHKIIDACLTPCFCDINKYIYPAYKNCEVIQSFVVANIGKDFGCEQESNSWNNNLIELKSQELFELAKKKDAPGALDNGVRSVLIDKKWYKWCQRQCFQGTGGNACVCDFIP